MIRVQCQDGDSQSEVPSGVAFNNSLRNDILNAKGIAFDTAGTTAQFQATDKKESDW